MLMTGLVLLGLAVAPAEPANVVTLRLEAAGGKFPRASHARVAYFNGQPVQEGREGEFFLPLGVRPEAVRGDMEVDVFYLRQDSDQDVVHEAGPVALKLPAVLDGRDFGVKAVGPLLGMGATAGAFVTSVVQGGMNAPAICSLVGLGLAGYGFGIGCDQYVHLARRYDVTYGLDRNGAFGVVRLTAR